jgi:hypothetical protein
MKPRRLSATLLRWSCVALFYFVPFIAKAAQPDHPAFNLAALQKAVGKDWRASKIPEGYLLTSIQPIVFLPTISPSTKKDRYQQVASARRDFLRIKIVFGAPVGDTEIKSLSIIDYVLPEVERQQGLSYFPCWNVCLETERSYLSSHRSSPIYLLSNVGPYEDVYPQSTSDQYEYVVDMVSQLFDFPPDIVIEN